MATLYQQIASNKRRSLLLVSFVVALVVSVVALYSYSIRGDFVLPIVAAIIAIPSALIGYYQGDKIALATNRARELPLTAAPEIHRIIENLAITAGVPSPKIYLIQSSALNAFATGRDPKHASVALTSGLVEQLDRSELEAVIAHELSHVKNYDIRFATLVAIFVGFVVILSDIFLRMTLWGGARRSGNNRDGGGINALLGIIGFILLLLSPLFAKLIQLAVSRQREYLADASAALLTRYPEGLARALKKISQGPELRTAGKATAHLFFASPWRAKGMTHLFSTHPPVEERIKRLLASA